MSITITGTVNNGIIVPSSPLPEGARVEIHWQADRATSGKQGVPASQVRGIAATSGSPPDDETVKRWIHEHRMEKYG